MLTEWSEVLAGLTADDIKAGLANIGGQYPPNVYQFRAACLAGRLATCHKRFKSLPSPKADEATAMVNIEKMRAVLHGGCCNDL